MIKKYLFLTIALLTALVCRAQDGPTYTLTVSVNNEQGATPNGSGTYEAGQTVYVYVNLTTDYKLVKWTENGNDLETDVPRTSFQYVMPDHDVELKAYVSYNPETPEDPNVDERVFRTLTVITLPANTNVAVDTYQLEVGKTQTLSYPSPTDYRFLGWYLNGELVCETGNYLMTMPDHDLTLERRYVYDPTVPANPSANTWYYMDNGLIELIIDDFYAGGLSSAISYLKEKEGFSYDMVGSIIVKGKVYSSDFNFYQMNSLKKIDFSRTDLKRIESNSWKKTGLTTVLLPSSLEHIESNCFKDCPTLNRITCLATTPPTLDRNVFEGIPEGAFLYVPAASIELYQEAEQWKDFIIYPLTDELTSLNVTLPLACADGRCKNMRLEVMNAKSGVRQKYIITDRMTYTFDLIHDCTYNIYIVSQKGEVLSQMENIELGTTPVNVTLPDLKTFYDVTLNVVLNNGTDVTNQVTTKWFDAEGNVLVNGPTVQQLTEGYQLSAIVVLPEALARVCQMPERVEHTVAATDNKITVTLQPLEQKALCALVVNDEDGTYLNGAWLQATQTLNGRYNHNASGTTDTYGSCELTLFSGVPATVTVSMNGYYNETVSLNNVAELEYLPTIRLKPFKGTTVTLLMEGYDDYKDLYVDVYNNTKEGNVSGFRLQYPYLVLPEGIDEDDVLAITAHSQQHRFADVTQTMTVKDGKLILSIVAKGSVEATYGESKNEAVRAMLYNADGRLVEAKKCEIRQATFSYLPEGDYTVLMMGSSQLFEGISSLNDFNRLGLTEGKNFVKQTVSVKLGETAEVDFAAVPLFVEGKFSYVSNKASFICTTPHPRNGYATTFRAGIDFKEAYRDGIKNLRLIIDYDNNSEFVDGSVVLNTQLHDYAQGEQTVEIDDLTNGDEVKFCLLPINDGTITATAYVEFDYDGQRLRQPLGAARIQVYSVELFVPEETPTPELTINLMDIPYGIYKSVEFYDNGVLIGTIPDLTSVAYYDPYADINWSGIYDYGLHSSPNTPGNRAALRCKLNDPYYYSYHNLQAKLLSTDGTEKLTQTKTVLYNPAAIVPSDIGFYQVSMESASSMRGGGGYTLPGKLITRYNPAINIGYISRSLSARSYSVSPKNQMANLHYFVHFLQNDKLPDMLKNREVVLTKYYRTTNETKDFHMTNWMDLPSTQMPGPGHPIASISHLFFKDDAACDSRYLQYGEPYNPDMKIFHFEETCKLEDCPRNLALSYEYADDFEFPEDTESNNRFVKMMKAALAEQERLINQLNSVIEQIQAKLDNNQTDWNALKPLVEEANSLANKLNGGVEVTLTDEQEQLIQKMLLETTTDAEREAIWNQLCPDLTQKEEYKKVEQWNQAQMTSQIYVPPYELAEGVWTPSYTYIVGTPTTGNILQDMSDGNWYLDENESDYDACKFVFVCDKGGDRFIIDYSEHLADLMSSRALDKEEGGSRFMEVTKKLNESIASAGIDWAIGKAGEKTAENAVSILSESANNQLENATKYLAKAADGFTIHPDNYSTEALYNHAWGKYIKAARFTQWIAKHGESIKAVGSAVGVGASIYSLYKTSQKNFDTYYKDDWAWEQLIMFADANCGNNDDAKRLMQQMKDERDENAISNDVKTIFNTITAGAAAVIGIWAPESGTSAAIVAAGLDCTIEGAYMVGENKLINLRKDFARQLSQIPGCEHATLFLPITDDVTPIYDPSGYVYEAVPSNRLEGVTATCYYKDSIQNGYGDWEVHEALWDASEFEQVNPQQTDDMGKYGWDVPMGKWQVRYEKDGYEPTRSEWLPVPPPQLEVNIPMVQRTAPEVEMAHAYQDGVELLFSKYMQPETLTPEYLRVKVVRGGQESFVGDLKVELLDEEAAAKGSETTYASHLRLTSETGWKDADEVMLIVNHRVKSYCGVPMQEDYMQQLDVELRIEQIETEEKVEMALGDSQELKVAVVPAEAGAGKTLRLMTTTDNLLEINNKEVELDKEGKGSVILKGKTVGSTTMMLTIDGELAEEMVVVEVLDPANMVVEKPMATPGSGSVLKAGEKVTLTTDTKDAQIYYTTDGSCPCDEQGSRRLYTEPIVITGETVLKAMAVKKGWYDSDIATFIFVVDGEAEGIVETPLQPATNTVQIYDLQGRRVNASQAHKGIFIVVGEGDMKPRKTVIK